MEIPVRHQIHQAQVTFLQYVARLPLNLAGGAEYCHHRKLCKLSKAHGRSRSVYCLDVPCNISCVTNSKDVPISAFLFVSDSLKVILFNSAKMICWSHMKALLQVLIEFLFSWSFWLISQRYASNNFFPFRLRSSKNVIITAEIKMLKRTRCLTVITRPASPYIVTYWPSSSKSDLHTGETTNWGIPTTVTHAHLSTCTYTHLTTLKENPLLILPNKNSTKQKNINIQNLSHGCGAGY